MSTRKKEMTSKLNLKNLKEFYATDKVGNECLIEALEKRVGGTYRRKKIV